MQHIIPLIHHTIKLCLNLSIKKKVKKRKEILDNL